MAHSVGRLWKKEKNNMVYYTGFIETSLGVQTAIAVVPNDTKKKDNHPDYNIILRKPVKNK